MRKEYADMEDAAKTLQNLHRIESRIAVLEEKMEDPIESHSIAAGCVTLIVLFPQHLETYELIPGFFTRY